MGGKAALMRTRVNGPGSRRNPDLTFTSGDFLLCLLHDAWPADRTARAAVLVAARTRFPTIIVGGRHLLQPRLARRVASVTGGFLIGQELCDLRLVFVGLALLLFDRETFGFLLRAYGGQTFLFDAAEFRFLLCLLLRDAFVARLGDGHAL